MAKSTKAILKHYSSTLEKPQHDDCPTGKKSWCSFQRDVANKEHTHRPTKNPFPPAIFEVMQPVFDRLGDESLLAACEKCLTQNTNESLHHVIWSMAPKEQYTSPNEISCAISLGVMQYNRGFERTYGTLLDTMGLEVTAGMKSSWYQIDRQRIRVSNFKSQAKVLMKRRKKKAKKAAAQDAFVHQEGIQYKSGNFHNTSKQPQKNKRKSRK